MRTPTYDVENDALAPSGSLKASAREMARYVITQMQGGVAPDVQLAIRIAATAAGVGEIGWSKVFLTKKYGPRQRLAASITDMPLEPDPLVEPGTICKRPSVDWINRSERCSST